MAIPPAPTSVNGTGTTNSPTLNATMVTNGFLPSGYSEFLLDGQPVLTKPGPTAGSGVSITGSFTIPDNKLMTLSCRNRNSDGTTDLASGSTKKVMGPITVAPPGFKSMVRLDEWAFRLTFDAPLVKPTGSPLVSISGTASRRDSTGMWQLDSSAIFTVDSTGVLVELDNGTDPAQILGLDVRLRWAAYTPSVLVQQYGPEAGRAWTWNDVGGPSYNEVDYVNNAPGGARADLTKPIKISWQRVSSDGSPQTWFQVEVWQNNVQKYQYSASSSDPFHTIPANTLTGPTGTLFDVIVRTHGIMPAPGMDAMGYSAFYANPIPVLTVVSPAGSAVNSNKYVFQFSIDQPISSYTARLKKGSTVVETKPVIISPPYPAANTLQSFSFDAVLENGESYSVEINARSSTMQDSGVYTKAFTTSFTLPLVVSVASCVEDADFNLLFTTSAPDASVDMITWSRSTDGGLTWSKESASIPRAGTSPFTFTDSERPLLTSIQYRITSYSPQGGISSSVYAFTRSSPYMSGMWSSGPNFYLKTLMRIGNADPPRADATKELQKELYYFAGRTKPVEISSVQTSAGLPVKFVVLSVAAKDRCLEQALLPGPHLIRMPDNTTYYCSIGAVATVRIAPDSYEISFNATEVEQ